MSKKFSPLKHARNFRSCDPSAVLLTHGSFSLYSEVLFYSTTIPVLICVMTYRKPKNTNKWLVNRAPSSIAKSARLMSIFIFIGHRRCAYYIFRRWVFLFIFFFQSPSRLDLTSDCHNQYQYRKVVEVAVIWNMTRLKILPMWALAPKMCPKLSRKMTHVPAKQLAFEF